MSSLAMIKILNIWLAFPSPQCFTFRLPIHELHDAPYPANGLSENVQLEIKTIS